MFFCVLLQINNKAVKKILHQEQDNPIIVFQSLFSTDINVTRNLDFFFSVIESHGSQTGLDLPCRQG